MTQSDPTDEAQLDPTATEPTGDGPAGDATTGDAPAVDGDAAATEYAFDPEGERPVPFGEPEQTVPAAADPDDRIGASPEDGDVRADDVRPTGL